MDRVRKARAIQPPQPDTPAGARKVRAGKWARFMRHLPKLPEHLADDRDEDAE